MKTQKLISLFYFIILISLVISSCKKTTEDEFNDANDDVVPKYISSIGIVSDDFNQTEYININYSSERVSNISYGEKNHFFVYDENNNLSMITENGEPQDVSSLFLTPYEILLPLQYLDKIRAGNVLDFDSKGNPSRMEYFIDNYEYSWTEGYYLAGTDTLYCEILYDPNPNPIFYSLKAAGLINVLDQTELIFGTQSPEIIKARQLLPYNNIKTMAFKDLNGITKSEIKINSTYDSDKYPSSATILVINDVGTFLHIANYSYNLDL